MRGGSKRVQAPHTPELKLRAPGRTNFPPPRVSGPDTPVPMSLPDQTPKLPKLPFLVGDAILLGVAWLIVYRSAGPLSANAIAAVTACVAVGALLGVVPFLTDYARKQDEALDDRQRGLEALSRTVNTAAEQISIAANGLQEITDLLHRNLKHAEQLPQKLQEKIAEFNAQLDNVREDDREELEKELVELRASESERLQAVTDRIHKAIGELTKLDASAQKHVAEHTKLVEKASTAIESARTAAAAALGESASAAARTLAAAQSKALAEIDAKFAERTAAAVAAIETAVATTATTAAAQLAAAPASNPTAPVAASESKPEFAEAGIASPPKRPRKARREDVSHDEPAAGDATTQGSALESAESTPPAGDAATEPAAGPTALSPEPASADVEPSSGSIAAVPPAEPVDRSPTGEPEAGSQASSGPTEPEVGPPSHSTVASGQPVSSEPERPARKRARKPAPEQTADLTLELGGGEFASPGSDDAPVTSSEIIERVISSDGATRLIATAYIGIGNRLFIRGDGPGLSWEKGVPLQFVSIGKWRWETAEATAPFTVKLYKNDEIECGTLGMLTLDPGHQQEVTAKF